MIRRHFPSTLSRVVLFAILLGGCSSNVYSDLVMPDELYKDDILSRFEREDGSGMGEDCSASGYWNYTMFDKNSSVQCDRFLGYSGGTAYRDCGAGPGGWDIVDYSNCSQSELWVNISNVTAILGSEGSTTEHLTHGISAIERVYDNIFNEGPRVLVPRTFVKPFAMLFNNIVKAGLPSNAKDDLMTDQAVTLLDSAEGIVGSLDLDATVNVTEPFIGVYGHWCSSQTLCRLIPPDDFQLPFLAATFELPNFNDSEDFQVLYFALNNISHLFSRHVSWGKIAVDPKSTPVFVSNVVSAQVCQREEGGECKEVNLLNSNWTVHIWFNLTVPVDEKVDYFCAFWNSTRSLWVVEWDGTVEDDQVLCEVNHLTAFAVVKSVTTPTTPAMVVGLSVLVSAPLYAGCALAILFLLGVIAFFISLRKELYSKPSNFVHLNISLALILSFALLCLAVNGGGGFLNRDACEAFSFFLHWVSLAPAGWSLCEGLLIANSLLWKPVSDRNLLIGLSALGWVVPLVIASISIAAGHPDYLIAAEDEIFGCWLPKDKGLYWSFVVPVILSVLLFIALLVVIVALWFRVKLWGIIELSSSEEWDLLKSNAKLTGISSLIMLLYSLTFLFGLIALNTPSSALSFLFCIASVLLVVVVVILYVICNDKDYGGLKHKAQEAFKTHCFGSRKRCRGGRRPQENPVKSTFDVELHSVMAVENIYDSADVKETADVGNPDGDSVEKARQDISL